MCKYKLQDTIWQISILPGACPVWSWCHLLTVGHGAASGDVAPACCRYWGALQGEQLLGWHVSLEVSPRPDPLCRMTLSRANPFALLFGEGKSRSTSLGGVACALCQ